VEHEPIILDVGSILNGYCSDMTRTVFLGGPSPYFKQIYNIVREAQISAINSIKIGMDSVEADSIARDVIKAGFGDFLPLSWPWNWAGAARKPYLGPRNSEVLQEGMVLPLNLGYIYLVREALDWRKWLCLRKKAPGSSQQMLIFYNALLFKE